MPRGSSRMPQAAARRASAAACSAAPAARSLSRRKATPPGSSRETQAAGIRASQHGGLLGRVRLPQAVQQAGHGPRVVEGGWAAGSRASSAAAFLCAPAFRSPSSRAAPQPGL